jgi:tetratricopeptide (TPR) repeat protein/tRNA A-37 threonylcarbamoyl transferase component Bud32
LTATTGERTLEAGNMTKDPGLLDTVGSGGGDEALLATVDSGRPAAGEDATLTAPPTGPSATEALPVVAPLLYAERRVLTSGGMGRILTGVDTRLKRKVAIKELRADNDQLRARFEREALLTARLEHPNIVAVHEAGRWPSGEPFYAMRLVGGRSLDKVIAEDGRTFEARLALLPHVIAIADALAYAHDQRIIHRDLKPQNVMVGEFGETIVIDWGLGKDLDDTADDARDGGSSSATGHGQQTAFGEVLGTPAYMPPEQAVGDPADERSDVYAIGAILYQLLSGQAPFGGRSTAEVLAAVRAGPPTPVEARVADVPHDLVAIVRRAMAREPADRYASARGLADDLRRFQAGQLVGAHRYTSGELLRRWLRRHRVAVTVAAILASILAATVAIAFVRVRAERDQSERSKELAVSRENEAQARRVAAEKLVTFMVTDLRDRLMPIGRLDALQGAASSVLDYYKSLGDWQSDDRASLERQQNALTILGQVQLLRGDATAALQLAEQSLAISSLLHQREPDNLTATTDLAISDQALGDAEVALGSIDKGVAAYTAGLDAAMAALATHPDAAQLRVEAGMLRSLLGDAEARRGNLDLARSHYLAAIGVLSPSGAAATDRDQRRQVGVDHTRLGNIARRQQRLDDALAEYQTSLATKQALLAEAPDDTAAMRDLEVANSKVGLVELQLHHADLGRAKLDTALGLAKHLVDVDPTNREWLADLASTNSDIAQMLFDGGDGASSLGYYTAALDASERAAAQDPHNDGLQRELAISYGQIAEVEGGLGHLDLATAHARKALAIVDRRAAEHATMTDALRDRATQYELLGSLAEKSKDWPTALASYGTTIDVLEAVVKAHADDAESKSDLAEAYSLRGNAAVRAGQPATAEADYRRSLALHQGVAPSDADNDLWIAVLEARIAKLIAARDAREARALAAAAAPVFEKNASRLDDEQRALLAAVRAIAR